MNIKKFVEKAIELCPAFGNVPMEQGAALVVRWGFPEPRYGATVIEGFRQPEDNSVDEGLRVLREFTAQLVEGVIGNCISVVQAQGDLTADSQQAVIDAIRKNFEIVVH